MCDYCNSIKILGQPSYISKYRNSEKNGKNQEWVTKWGQPPPPTPMLDVGGRKKKEEIDSGKIRGEYSIKGGVTAAHGPV